MDGAKLVTDTIEQSLVGRCSEWVEVYSREYMDHAEIKILAIVRSK